jgi:hypothetical protein
VAKHQSNPPQQPDQALLFLPLRASSLDRPTFAAIPKVCVGFLGLSPASDLCLTCAFFSVAFSGVWRLALLLGYPRSQEVILQTVLPSCLVTSDGSAAVSERNSSTKTWVLFPKLCRPWVKNHSGPLLAWNVSA